MDMGWYVIMHLLYTYRIAGNFREHKLSRVTPRKKFRDFYFRVKVMMSDHTYNSRIEMVTHCMYFQRQNDSKISTLVKACRSL